MSHSDRERDVYSRHREVSERGLGVYSRHREVSERGLGEGWREER